MHKTIPPAGPSTGFEAKLSLPAGQHNLCVFAINVGAGTTNPRLGCRTITVGGNPFGNLDSARLAGPGRVTLNGWALDPDTAAATTIHIYSGSRFIAAQTTDRVRADVTKTYPGFGSTRGFTTSVDLPAGRHNLCAYAINVGAGTTNSQLGCRTITVGGNPFGNLDTVAQQGPGEAVLNGWALDPDTADAVSFRFTVDGQPLVTATTTPVRRPDVARLYPGFGDERGFQIAIALPNGTHRVCAIAINSGWGTSDAPIGCQMVTIGGSPRGAMDAATPAGFARADVAGWAVDPDTADSLSVRVTVNGRVTATVVANDPHPTAGGLNPGFGDRRSFSATINLGPGSNQICAVGINIGLGTDTELGCQTLNTSGSPRGTLDSVSRVGNQLRLRGWAFDPDTEVAATVIFTVNGVQIGQVAASSSRPDVAMVYPGFGPDRGFDLQLSRPAGGQVCATVRNVGAGANISIGCKPIP